MIKLMDLIIAPDSSVAHLAAGLGVPLVGIYGPFPWDLRIKYYPKTRAFNAPSPCAPCFTHGHKPCSLARSQGLYYSPCFNALDVDEITDSAAELLADPKPSQSYVDYLQIKRSRPSETSKFRSEMLATYTALTGKILEELSGIDVGCGGDAIVGEAISMDFAFPYTKCGYGPIQLKGNSRHLPWFSDGGLDYLYSSHLFEDFDRNENLQVLREWARIIRPGGHLLLLLPDQSRYGAYCNARGEDPNEHHKIPEFGPKYFSDLVQGFHGLRIIHESSYWEMPGREDDYNFFVILQKNKI